MICNHRVIELADFGTCSNSIICSDIIVFIRVVVIFYSFTGREKNFFHGSSAQILLSIAEPVSCTYAARCYVIRTLPVLLGIRSGASEDSVFWDMMPRHWENFCPLTLASYPEMMELFRGIILEKLDLFTLQRNSLYFTESLSSFPYRKNLPHSTPYYLFNTNFNIILPLIFTYSNCLRTFHQFSLHDRKNVLEFKQIGTSSVVLLPRLA